MMIDDYETDADRLQRHLNTEWYLVTISGTNPDGESDIAEVQMGDNIDLALQGWTQHKAWTNTKIVNKQYIGPVPPKTKLN